MTNTNTYSINTSADTDPQSPSIFFLAFPDQSYAADSPARPMEVLRVGTFTSMNGKIVTVTEDDLDAFVTNFNIRAAGQDIPIDVQHERREAAGWLVSLYRQADKLIAIPNWNDLGKELVGSQAFRYVSAALDLARKLLISVSLTNFPAVKELQPISLSGSIEGQIIIQEDHMTNATDAAGNIVQADATSQPETPPATNQPVVTDMSDSVRALLNAELSEFRTQMAQAIDALKLERAQAMTAMLTELREERDIAEFAHTITSTGNHALPLRADDVRTMLLDLPVAHRSRVRAMLSQIAETGTVDFSEIGTSRGNQDNATHRQLDNTTAAMLTQFLKAGGNLDEFFSANQDVLGSMSDYDLTAFGGNNG